MTLAALEATLELYQDPERARREIPTLRYLTRDPAETAALAAALQGAIERRCAGGFILEVEQTSARAGGGVHAPGGTALTCRARTVPRSAPAGGWPGRHGLARGRRGWPRRLGGHHRAILTEPLPRRVFLALEAELRRAPVPVVARISQDSMHLDVIALDADEVEAVAESLAWAIERVRPGPAIPRRVAGGHGRSRCFRSRPGDDGPPAEPRRRLIAPLTLGTAGHIDHGKTTLIKALTGRDTDRLKEEKERGISIELGYAQLVLPGGRPLSLVDVPGHERFVRTMVAGATGIDLFLLVVAADDGVMPQTREHLRIIELLGIPAGVVALTKVDTVEAEMAELAQADVEEFLLTTRYPEAPIVAVSGVTGEGLPDLLATLDQVGDSVPPRASYPATRMPVDRVFSLKGVGTVVTGTLWSGSLSAEDRVALLPRERVRARVPGARYAYGASRCTTARWRRRAGVNAWP